MTSQNKKSRQQSKELKTDLSVRTDRNKGLTIPCTEEQYEEIIHTLWNGSYTIRKNRTVAVALMTEANTGLRIGDVMGLRLDDIIFDNGKYRFHMYEQKTGKLRIFTVPTPVYNMLYRYARHNNIKSDEPLFNMTVRNAQKKLDQVTDYLGYRYISTHSFRKRFAIRAYELSNYDVNLVRTLLQHSDTATTIKYLGVSDDKVEKVLKRVVNIVEYNWEDNDMTDNSETDDMKHSIQNRPDTMSLKCDVSRKLIEKVDSYCAENDLPINAIVEEALTEYLSEHKIN